jgi:hypothetical protein
MPAHFKGKGFYLTDKSYPQKLCTGAKTLWDTPNAMRKLFIRLTRAIRSNRLKRAAEALSARGRIDLMGKVYAILAVLSITGTLNANAANYSIDHLKLYAHSRILDYKQFQCFNKIITQESRWSYVARNGSHYGLGQMRSTHYRDLDPYRQIDSTLRYITKRYQTPCKAWTFHVKHGYY